MLFAALIWRPLRRDLARTALSVAAIALGVAVVVAIRLANRSAVASFAASAQSLAGGADLLASGPAPIAAALLPRLAALGAEADFSPYLDRRVLDAGGHDSLELLGLDFVSLPRPPGTPAANANAGPGLYLGADYAARHGYRAGGSIELIAGAARQRLPIAGLLPAAAGDVAVLDLEAAMALCAPRGNAFDGLRIQLAPGVSAAALAEQLAPLLPAGDTVAPPAARVAGNEKMLAAFHANLDALAGVSLLIGLFLIYNTVSISVVRRRVAVATLRALGVRRGAILRLFLLEGLALASLGAAAGIGLGLALAATVTALVTGTVNSLYAQAAPLPVRLTAADAGVALALALGAGLLAALAPARRAARQAPALALRAGSEESEARARRTPLLLGAAGLAGLALLLPRLPEPAGIPVFGFLDALAAVGVMAALTLPLLGWLLPRARALCLRRGRLAAGLAAGSLASSLRRSSVLALALATAIGVMFGVAIMVGSFRETVRVWIGQQLQADVFVRAAGWTREQPTPLPADWIERLAATPGVAGVAASHTQPWRFRGETVLVNVRWWLRAAAGRRAGPDYRFLAGGAGPGVLVSEPFARRFGLGAGDEVTLEAPCGALRLRVAGVFYDYTAAEGELVLPEAVERGCFGAPAATELGFYAAPGVAPGELARRLQYTLAAAGGGAPALTVYDAQALGAEAMAVFDRTFRITWGLEAITLLVAMLGAANTLLAVVLERARELAVLRCLGATRAQTRQLLLAEAGWIGAIALGLGGGLGAALAVVLIRVINVQSFGWTIQTHVPWAFLALSGALVWLATLAAGWFPAATALGGAPGAALGVE